MMSYPRSSNAPHPMPVVRQRLMTACVWMLACWIVASVGGCRPSTNASSTTAPESNTQSIAIQLNWYPEVEHGGVYQAATDGTYKGLGLQVEIRPGGRATPIAPELVLGRCQFAITNADDVVLFRAQNADVVAVLAAIQEHPRCILVRADSGVETFADLPGMTLQRQAGRPFLTFLERRGFLEGVRQVPYHNSIAAMVADPKIAVQAYAVAEPLLAQQQGLEVRTLMVSELGWNPYSSVLVTTGEMIRDRPELVSSVVAATRLGWQSYLQDPAAANAAILSANQHGMTEEVLRFGAEKMVPLARADDDIDHVGQMTQKRWVDLVEQMIELELIASDTVAPQDCFTTEFLE
ncbi:MAG: ABC transporter substrate-binding protein [Planctomycetota bacterium]